MKKTVRILFLFALFFTVAGAVAVSCQKGGEEDVPEVGGRINKLVIQPMASLSAGEYIIEVDGTTISGKSIGYSFDVLAKAVTFDNFICILDNDRKFLIVNDCDLTLKGNSVFSINYLGTFWCRSIKLSGNGSFKLEGTDLNVFDYENTFSAAEGYTLTSTGKVDEGNGLVSCTWTVKKSN